MNTNLSPSPPPPTHTHTHPPTVKSGYAKIEKK